jgi:hypothetical protein
VLAQKPIVPLSVLRSWTTRENCWGSLDGVEGILLVCSPDSRLVVSIQLIQSSLAVSVYNFDVEPFASSGSTVAYAS